MQTGKTNFTSDERSSKLNKHKLDSDLYYKENGVTLDLTGIENVMGEDCYVLNRMEKSRKSRLCFYLLVLVYYCNIVLKIHQKKVKALYCLPYNF